MGVNVGRPDVLIKLNEQDGKLTFDGVPVCDGEHSGGSATGEDTPLPTVTGTVALVDSFADLDPDAADGSLALAKEPVFDVSPLDLNNYDADHDRYRIPDKRVSFNSEIEYRESVYTRALQNFMSSYPIVYHQYWSGAIFEDYYKPRGVFRKNDDGTYTEITDNFHTGDSVAGYWYADRDHCFYMEAEINTTHIENGTWDDEELYMTTIPVIRDAQNNVYKQERVECEGIMCDGILAPDATTNYLIGAMWDGDTRQRTFLELFPGAEKVGGNIYRIPAIYLYSFEDMDGSFEYEQDDDSDRGYHMETIPVHLQAGWNVLFLLGALEYDAKDKRWELESVSIDSVEPMDGAPAFSVQTDETGTLEFHREIDALLFEGALVSKQETHPYGMYIKSSAWLPISNALLPKVTSVDYSDDISELYERTDEITNDLEDNPPHHSNRQVLDRLTDNSGSLTYNGNRIRTVSSISFASRNNEYDTYTINYSDGTQETFRIQHPAANNIEAVTFFNNGKPRPDGCLAHYTNGEMKNIHISGMDVSIAFANFNDNPDLHSTRLFGDNRVYLKLGGSSPTEGGYSQYIDLAECDRNTAKLDYIDMMFGLGFETEGLYDRAQRNYNAGYWTDNHLRQAVEHGWIGTDDFLNMTGEPYATDEEDDTNDQD